MKKTILILLVLSSFCSMAQTTSTIIGVGTVNKIPKFIKPNRIGDSNIFDNGVNVGIKTATPTATLDVNGSGKFTGVVTITTVSPFDSSTKAASTAFVKKAIAANSTDAWLIKGNANIGANNFLGTTNDADLVLKRNNLDVFKADGTNTTIYSNATNFIQSDGVGTKLFSDGGATFLESKNGVIEITNPITGEHPFYANLTSTTLGANGNSNLIISNNNVELNGNLTYNHPSKSAGKVLTSDANGGATWQVPGGVNLSTNYNWTGLHDITANSSNAVLTLRNTQAYGTGGNYTQRAINFLGSDGSTQGWVDANLGRMYLSNMVQCQQFTPNSTSYINGGRNGGLRMQGVQIDFINDFDFLGNTLKGAWFLSDNGGFVIDAESGNSVVDVPSSKFTVKSTLKGSIPFPIMTSTEKNAIASPAVGLHVYQTDGTEGVYVRKSSGWVFAY